MTTDKPQEAASSSRPPTRGEWIYLAIVLLLAAAARFADFSQLDVEHFDEGVYASNAYCGHLTPAYQYPLRHLYAPPLWPAILEWTIILLGDEAVMLPGILFGIATVALVWWVARTWYGPTGAALACTLLAFFDIHVMFSRTALTDVPMAFFMLAGVFAGWQTMMTRSPYWLAAAGVLAGLAWDTKYNGWLTLAVIGSASIAWRYVERKDADVVDTRPPIRALVIAAIAFVIWLPVLFGMSDVGGYASVRENHAQYFVGVTGWWTSAMRQLQMGNLASVHGTIWPLVGLVSFGVLAIRPPRSGTSFFLASILGTRLTVLTSIVPSLGTSIKSLKNLAEKVEERQTRKFATWLSLAWLFGLTLAIPLYTPYLRLVVPLIPVGCLVWADLGTRHDQVDWSNRQHVSIAVGLLLVVAGLWRIGGHRIATAGDAAGIANLSQRSMARQFADQALDSIPGSLQAGDPRDVVIYVYGEPAVYFQIARQEGTRSFEYIAQPAGNLGILDRSKTDPRLTPFVVVGPHGFELTPEIASDTRLQLIWEGDLYPGRVVALDRATPEQLNELATRNIPLHHAIYRVKRLGE